MAREPTTDTPSPSTDAELRRRARRNVNRKLGFLIHATVFAVINVALLTLDAAITGGRWSHLPLFGWGLGLAIHGLVTLLAVQGDGLRERMLHSELRRLDAGR